MPDDSLKPGITRRAFSALGTVPLLASPALIASARAMPTDGVRFVAMGEESADTLSVLYNLTYANTPSLRALCQTPQGVSNTIRWARESGRSFALRSGGHCYAGTSQHPDLVIDLREMNNVFVQGDTRRMQMQAGAKLGDLHRAGFPHDLAVPAGWCADVGAGGHTLGGGIGYLVRAHGLLCDHLESVELVDAEGELRHCSRENNPDLFWACQGGGGGLGVATQFTLNAVAMQPLHFVRVFGGVAPERAADVWARWSGWSSASSRETSTQLNVNVMSDGRMFFRITGLSTLDPEELTRQLRDIATDDLPVGERSLLSGTYAALMEEHILSVPAFYLHAASRSSFLPANIETSQLSDVLDALTGSVSEHGSVGLLIEGMGGAVDDLDRTATAYPHRGAGFLVTASVAGVSQAAVEGQTEALQAVDSALRTGAVGRGYANYRDRLLGEEYATAYWVENLPRLQAVKQAVDPDGVFSSEHTVPLPA